ncbi:MAG: cadherin domain-containing protein [Burkholderiaceae bacterium]
MSFVSAPDYELPTDANGDNVYEVMVQVDDGGGRVDDQTLTVNVTPVNDNAPRITSNGGGATAIVGVPENTTWVTNVVAVDADQPAQTVGFAIVGGADAARFSIDPVTSELTLVAPLDREAPVDANLDNVYEVTVEASDGLGLVDTQAISMTVLGVNEAPVATGDTSITDVFEEDAAAPGDTIANLFLPVFSDPDLGDSLGGIAVRGNPSIPAEGSWQYSIDGGASWNDFGAVSDASALALGLADLIRFLPATDFVGSPSSLSVRLIDANLSIIGGATLDASVNGGQTPISANTSLVSTGVLNVNDAPDGADATLVATEDTPLVLGLADFGFGDSHDTPSNALAAVRIDTLPTGGAITRGGSALVAGSVVTGAQIVAGDLVYTPAADANGVGIDSFRFSVIDDGGTANGGIDTDPVPNTLSIDVLPVNDAPIVSSNLLSIEEGQRVVLTPAMLSATDIDNAAGGLSFSASSIIAGRFERVDNPGVAITGFTQTDVGTGQIAFVHDGSETPPSYTLTVSDGALVSAPSTVSVSYVPVNEAPTLGGASFGTAENTPATTRIGTLSATDPDTGDVLSFSIVDGNVDGAFSIDAATGELSVANPAALDFETRQSFTLTVQATDSGGLTSSATVTIALTDVNEPPTDLLLVRVNAITRLQDPYGTVLVADPDAGETFSYVLVDDASGKFQIDAGSGVVSAVPTAVSGLSSGSSYRIVVTATDSAGHAITRAIDFAIPPVSDAVTGTGTTTITGTTAPPPADKTPSKSSEPVAPTETDDSETARRLIAAVKATPEFETQKLSRVVVLSGEDAIALRETTRGGGVARSTTTATNGADAVTKLLRVAFDQALPGALADAGSVGDWVSERMSIRRGDLAFTVDSRPPEERAKDEAGNTNFAALLGDPVKMTGAIVSSGAIWWLARLGGIATSMLLERPSWRNVDLLPVVMHDDADDDSFGIGDDGDEDERVDHLLDRADGYAQTAFGAESPNQPAVS